MSELLASLDSWMMQGMAEVLANPLLRKLFADIRLDYSDLLDRPRRTSARPLPNRIEPTEDDRETFTPWDDYAWQSTVLPSERFYRLGRWNSWEEDRTSIDESELEVGGEYEDADTIREWIAELPPYRRPRSRKKFPIDNRKRGVV